VENKSDLPIHDLKVQHANLESPKLESGGVTMISSIQLKELIENVPERDYLLLDLRVWPQYAQSHIKGALNLCIPTTLLKRATFNLEKLQHTFQIEHAQKRFANWRNTKHLILYDAFSSEKRDAVSAENTLKKFTNEGYAGAIYILRGGFRAFSSSYPHLVDDSSVTSSPGLSLNSGSASSSQRPAVVPVVGGVILPKTNNCYNPFFSNIRQNQELADGVGQMDISVPAGLDPVVLPHWLRDVAEVEDHGKKVSDKFLQIELAEQSRMKNAYSMRDQSAQLSSIREDSMVQLSGLEKGGKNRYKDILPFEHARVRLLGKTDGGCDYVNASHVKATRSHKQYIASQGPLPATFEVWFLKFLFVHTH
jgi:protein-tyrosine phosphatase